jgi:hypothetical protein
MGRNFICHVERSGANLAVPPNQIFEPTRIASRCHQTIVRREHCLFHLVSRISPDMSGSHQSEKSIPEPMGQILPRFFPNSSTRLYGAVAATAV